MEMIKVFLLTGLSLIIASFFTGIVFYIEMRFLGFSESVSLVTVKGALWLLHIVALSVLSFDLSSKLVLKLFGAK